MPAGPQTKLGSAEKVPALRHNPILKAFYLRLRDHGKPAKVALTAVMCKLTVLLAVS